MRKNQKGFSKILLISLIIVLIGVVGFFVYQNNYLDDAVSTNPDRVENQVAELSETPVIPEAQDEYSDFPSEIFPSERDGWSVLHNKTFSYEIQFPESWEVFDSCLFCADNTAQYAGYAGDISIKSPELEVNAVPVVLEGGYIAINGYKPKYSSSTGGLGRTSEKFCESRPLNEKECEDTTVGGQKAVKATYPNYNFVDVTIFRDNIGILFLRANYTDESKDTVLSVFNQILSTFKFTEETI